MFTIIHIWKSEHSVDKKMSKVLFVQKLTNKALLLRKFLKDTECSLRLIASIGPNMATFKLYDIRIKDSQKLHATISNVGDIEEQLYQLWLQLNPLLRGYCPLQLFKDWL